MICKRRPPALVVMMRAERWRLLWKVSNFFLLREDRRGTRAHRQKVRGLLSVAQAFYHDTSLPYRFADQEMMKNMANARIRERCPDLQDAFRTAASRKLRPHSLEDKA